MSGKILFYGIAAVVVALVIHSHAPEDDHQSTTEANAAALRKTSDDLPEQIAADPKKLKTLLCLGISPYEDPQPANLPRPSAEECKQILGVTPKTSIPSDNSPAAQYETIRTRYLDNTRRLWFAIGCGIVDEQSTNPLFRSMQIGLANALDISNGIDPHGDAAGQVVDPQLLPMIPKATREGIGMAHDTTHHVCDYWRNNPDAALRLKQVVADAANGIPP